MAQSKTNSSRILILDGWRGVAIALVLIDHASKGLYTGSLHRFLRLGATGVAIFFALSGFVITSWMLREAEQHGSVSLKKFYVRRLFRLVPAMLAYVACIGVLSATGLINVTTEQFLATLFFCRNYIPIEMWTTGWYTAHFWSLAVEEHFYLLWPALLIRSAGRSFLPAAMAFAVAVWRHIDLHYHVISTGLWFPGRTDVRLDGLLWGCVLAILLHQRKTPVRLSKFFSTGFLTVCVGLDLLSNLTAGRHNYSVYEPLLLALIVVWPLLNSGSWLATILEWPTMTWLGRLSYSLYVWQQLWLVFPGVQSPFGVFQRFPLNLICLFACGCVSYYLIERPMIEVGYWLTSRPQSTAILNELGNRIYQVTLARSRTAQRRVENPRKISAIGSN
jgi:peptidoglycan/LPS O-acetylase OafA/YrhL